MNFDPKEVVEQLDLQLEAHPNATLQIIAERMQISSQKIVESLQEVEGVTFPEYQANKRLARAFEQLGELSPAANGPYEITRARQRITIPNAVVKFQAYSFWRRSSHFSSQCPLMDLSGDGLAFITDRALKPKKRILLLLKLPGKDDFVLVKGYVAYIVATGIAGYRYRIGVHFLPFTESRGCNNLRTMETLAALEKTYAA